MTTERAAAHAAQGPRILPEGWKWCRIGEVVEATERRDPGRSPDQPFTYVDISSVDSATGTITKGRELLGQDAPSRARKVLRTGDVIFSTTRPYLRNVALVPASYNNQICSTGFCVLRANRKLVEPSWLVYLCRSDLVLSQIEPKMRGANYPAVTDKDVLSAFIPVPDLSLQRRIVSRVEALLSDVRKARALLKEMRHDADLVMDSALAEVLQVLDTRFLDSADLGSLISDERIKLFGGGTPAKSNAKYWVGTIPWISPKDMKRWKIEDATDHVSPAAIRETSIRLIPKGSVLVVTRGMILAHTWPVAVTISDVTVNQDMKALCPKADLLPEYLGYVLRARAPAVLRQVEMAAHGTRRLTTDKLNQVVVPSAPPKVQKDVISYLDTIQSEVDEIGGSMTRDAALLDQLEQSILERAFRGEV